MLKIIKQNLLRSAKALKIFDILSESSWRQNKLLILAYHGISLEDEHFWNSSLFVPPDFLRRRSELIKQNGCNVLPLSDAVERLYNKTLPKKAVVITFDDGNYDFYQQALPIIKEFNFPTTLYLTTFYCQYSKPVFRIAAEYLLWKAKSKTLDCYPLLGINEQIDLATENNRRRAIALIMVHTVENMFSAEQRNHLLERLSDSLGLNYSEFCRKRIMQIMNKNEVASVASAGIDVELHTHRHRIPLEENLFRREIKDNRNVINDATGKQPKHFCYPNGAYNPQVFAWMEAESVVSATTCETALAIAETNPFLLPRLVDTCSLSEVEFEGWPTGVSHFLPQRKST